MMFRKKARMLAWTAPVAAAFLAVGCSGGEAPSDPGPAPTVQTEAPPAGDASGELPPITPTGPSELAALFQAPEDQVLVVNFWATWCPPCVAEMPYFVRFYEEYDRDKAAFLSVTADHVSTLESAVLPFQEQHELPFPIYLMEGDIEEFIEALGIELSGALPVTLVYDRKGELREHWERDITYDELVNAVDPLLS